MVQVNNMAASMVRRLCVTAVRLNGTAWLFQRRLGTQESSFLTVLRNRLRNVLHPKTVTITGTTVGISYALFGFSFGKKEEEEEVDPLTQIYRDARIAHMQQDIKKADDLYHEALKLAGDLVKAKKITEEKFLTARTLMYDGLADIALQTGQVETAELLYKETMKGCMQQGMEQTHNAMVEIALKLASIYAIQGKKEEAEEGYKFCLQAQLPKMEAQEQKWKESDARKKSGKSSGKTDEEIDQLMKDTAALLGITLSSYGRFLLYEKRYKEALPLFEKARLYAEHTIGTNNNQYLVVLNDIATLYIVTKNLDEAESLLKEGITLSESNKLGEGAMLYCNLGAVYLRKGQVTEAMKICEKGLGCAREHDHKMAFSMAQACLKKGSSAKAVTKQQS